MEFIIDENHLIILLGLLASATIAMVVALWFYKWRYCREFWDNGKLRRKYFSKSKIGKYGKDTFFYRNGKVNKIRYWEKNELHGVSSVFYRTGEKYIETNYKNGKLDGEYIIFSKNGSVLKSCSYEDGIKILGSDKSVPIEEAIPKKSTHVSVTKLIEDNVVESFREAESTYQLIKAEEETKDIDKKKSGFLSGLKKLGKVATGIQGYQDRESAKNLKESCEKYYEKACEVTEAGREKLNEAINSFGKHRLNALLKTTGRFLGFLKDMKQENKTKEYEILEGIGLDTQTIKKMERVDMAASKALASTATTGALGAAAAMGTPTLVTGAVSALATASTGTAISTLSGVTATNATLAWLGGGSLAAGGGGMAAGATVLTSLTVGATAGVALIAAGLMASTHYSKKLTEVKENQKKIEIDVANREKLWVLMEGINKRTAELSFVTSELEQRILFQLEFLEPLTVDYDTSDEYYNSIFQKTGLFIKSMSELAEAPLWDENGNVSSESAQVIAQTYTILNKEIINNG